MSCLGYVKRAVKKRLRIALFSMKITTVFSYRCNVNDRQKGNKRKRMQRWSWLEICYYLCTNAKIFRKILISCKRKRMQRWSWLEICYYLCTNAKIFRKILISCKDCFERPSQFSYSTTNVLRTKTNFNLISRKQIIHQKWWQSTLYDGSIAQVSFFPKTFFFF